MECSSSRAFIPYVQSGGISIVIRKPKIGLAGMMCTPFKGNKESNFSRHRAALEDLSSSLQFDFLPILSGIYNADQAATAAQMLAEWGADFIILQSASFAAGDFVYPFANLPARLGVWSVPEGQPSPDGGLPLNSFTGANLYNSILRTAIPGYTRPVKWFLGEPGQEIFDRRLQVTVQALRALINLTNARIGLVGGVAPSFDNLIVNEEKLQQRLGISVVHFELDEVMERAGYADTTQLRATADEMRSSAARFDPAMENALLKSGRTSIALTELAQDHNLQALAVSCWPKFQSDHQLAVCSVLGHLNTNKLVTACEGDVTSAVSMYTLQCISNGEVVTLMDLATVDERDDSLLMWHCGPTSPSLADEQGTTMKSLYLFDGPNGERVGLHNDLVLKPGLASILGFTVDFERMLVLEGTVDNSKPSYSGSRGWMKGLRLNGEPVSTLDLVQTLMVSGFQHHYPFAYGEFTDAGLEICRWLGIEPVSGRPYTHYVI
jgi:L-fucose isomerase-like protein